MQKLLAVAELEPDKLFKVIEAEERANANATVLHCPRPMLPPSVLSLVLSKIVHPTNCQLHRHRLDLLLFSETENGLGADLS